MTYEPGQQVLVRGEALQPPVRVGLFVRFLSEDGEGRCAYIRAADVVGPAPATPDPNVRSLTQLLDEYKDALAEAEAELVTANARLATYESWSEGGPVPATPDEGAIAKLRAELAAYKELVNSDYHFDERMGIITADEDPVDAVQRLTRALAAAEARIAAALAEHWRITPESGEEDCGYCEVLWPCPTVRALSVEETGTEGGGECVCPKFNDTGGYRIADLACPIHGVKGTNPGDWVETGTEGGGGQ